MRRQELRSRPACRRSSALHAVARASSESRRRSPVPGSVPARDERSRGRGGCSGTSRSALAKPGKRVEQSRLEHLHREERDEADQRARRAAARRGRPAGAARRSRTRPRSSHRPIPSSPMLFIASAMCEEVLEELRRDVLVGRVLARRARGRCASGSGSTSPSRRCRRPARCSRRSAAARERSKTPMLSRPRKPPWKMLLPVGVLAVHPPGEVQQQLVEDPLQEVAVALARQRLVDLVDPPARPRRAPAGSRRRSPIRRRGAGRWGACTTRAAAAASCSLANSGSISAKATQWKARSQAAYQGYSHLSGIEMTSALSRCRQSLLRPCRRSAGGGGCAGSPSSQSAHVVVVELLGPEHPGERLALHQPARPRRRCRVAARRRTRPPRRDALVEQRVEVRAKGVARPRSVAAGAGASVGAAARRRRSQRACSAAHFVPSRSWVDRAALAVRRRSR